MRWKMSCLWRFLQVLEYFSVEIPPISTRRKWRNKLFLFFFFFFKVLSRISSKVIKPMRWCIYCVIVTGKHWGFMGSDLLDLKWKAGERQTGHVSRASWEHHLLQKRKALVQGAEELLSLSWGGPCPAPLQPRPHWGVPVSSTPAPTSGPEASCHLLLPSCITESPQALTPPAQAQDWSQ